MSNTEDKHQEPPRFLETPSCFYSHQYAAKYGCDLAIPSWLGLGSLVCYTRLVEEFALEKGCPLKILTAPHYYKNNPRNIQEPEEDWNDAIWQNNPYIDKIVDADAIDPAIMSAVNSEFDNFCQSRHEIINLCAPYNLRPRQLRGSLFLSFEEMQWGLRSLSHLKRPVVCLCPYGVSSSLPESPWYLDKWLLLVKTLKEQVSFLQIGHNNFEQKSLPVFTPKTTIRQMMALIWASDVYIGFDTGPSHIATALGKPSVVLWDAVRKVFLEEHKQAGFSIAHMERWAYPQNRNLVILGEKHHEILSDCVEFVLEVLSSFKRTHIEI
ncbi:glycosyltransferase family 9 protein [Scytonema sp. PCC 10023]|uniref:glycosyltransferase family 9 protein n=1 Tax=Scytonema sp. PCC 10023 TaxID=1680591 RepID=UPI0039C5E5F6